MVQRSQQGDRRELRNNVADGDSQRAGCVKALSKRPYGYVHVSGRQQRNFAGGAEFRHTGHEL